MSKDLFAALRTGVEDGSVPQPISGESMNDFRFRAAHAGAIIGIKWAQELAVATAEATAEAELYARLDQLADADVSELDYHASSQGWRGGDITGTSLGRPYRVPPEQNEAAGV